MYRTDARAQSWVANGAAAFAWQAQSAANDLFSVQKRPLPVEAFWRVLDIVISLAALVLLAPAAVVISLLIKLQDGGPILFSQERIGRDGRRFRCWKFRSMRPDAEVHLAVLLASDSGLRRQWELHRKLKDDPRITPLGDFLRRSSLDELPQLLNVLGGDMSIVGPRPIVDSEIICYDRWFRYYIAVKPGLTGLWQVSGRNDVSYRRRVAMDRFFCRAHSIKLYLQILLATAPAVLLRRGSY
jgi:lipopolysaccharide/colanic/teichoic acid biosynthesis glycosyltransferase